MTGPSRLPSPRILAAAVALAAVLTQLPGVTGTLLWDDAFVVGPGTPYVDPSRLREALSQPLGNMTFYWRPLGTTSLLADSLVYGGRAFGFRLTNALLHGGTSAAVLLLLVRLLPSRGAALLAALVWALHPVHVETVTWVSARFDLLAGLFAMLALVAADPGRPSRPRYAACAVATAAAFLSKESGLVVPVLVAVWTAALLRTGKPGERPGASVPLRFAAAAALGLGAALVLRLGVLGYVLRARPEAVADAGGVLPHLLLAGRAVATYLTTLVWPWGTVGPAHHAVRPVPPGDVLGWTGVALALALAAAAVVAWRRRRRTGLLLAAFVVTLAPVSQIVPLDMQGGLHAADRLLYLPAFFAVATVADLACALLLPAGTRTAAAIAGVLVVALAAGRLTLLPRWNDALRFWTWAAEMAPGCDFVHNNLAFMHLEAGRLDDAEREARRIAPADAVALAAVLKARGRPDEAVFVLDGVLRANPRHAPAALMRADLRAALGRLEGALADYETVVRLTEGPRRGTDAVRPRALAGLAEILAHGPPGVHGAARTWADRAEREARGDDLTWLRLASARIALRDEAGAARAIDAAAAANADARDIATVRGALDAMRRAR